MCIGIVPHIVDDVEWARPREILRGMLNKIDAGGFSFAGIAGSKPTGGMPVSCEHCVLSSRSLCDGTIPRREE